MEGGTVFQRFDENPVFDPYMRFKADYQWRVETRRRAPDQQTSVLELPILELLLNNISCEATDSRDMIYSLLGLATDITSAATKSSGKTFVCSYEETTPTEHVYTDFVKTHIETHQSLDILTFNKNVPPKRHAQLPSWVPDWSNLKDSSTQEMVPFKKMPPFYKRYTYQASGKSDALFEFLPGDILHVVGIQLDGMAKLRQAFKDIHGSNEFPQVFASWMQMAGAGFVTAGTAYRPYPTADDTTPWEAFQRTIIMDQNLEGQRADEDEWLHNTLLSDKKDDAGRLVRDKVYRTAYLRCRRRRFFITSSGYFGLGPLDMAPEDRVFVLLGCSVPMILRPHPEGHPGLWTLVGDAFVLGIMDGEIAAKLQEQVLAATAVGMPPEAAAEGRFHLEEVFLC